jgi:hypothetical protein
MRRLALKLIGVDRQRWITQQVNLESTQMRWLAMAFLSRRWFLANESGWLTA